MSEGLLIGILTPSCTVLGICIGKLIDFVANKAANRAKNNNIQMDTVSKLQANYIDVLDQLSEERKRYTDELNQMNRRISEQNTLIDEQSKLIESQKRQIVNMQKAINEANEKIDKLSSMLQLTCIDLSCPNREKYDITVHAHHDDNNNNKEE